MRGDRAGRQSRARVPRRVHGHGNGGIGRRRWDLLVLAAGALGTTGLLLAHARGSVILSRRVGEHYSANGDVVTGAWASRVEWRPTVGPAITAAIRMTRPYWYLIEDGGVPPMSVLARGVTEDDDPPCPPSFAESWEGVADVVGFGDVLDEDHAAILLGMGRDGGAGRIRPGAGGGDVDIEWPHKDNQAYYDAVVKFQTFLARRLGGHHVGSAHSRVSVHSLGGAVMADDPEHGVVKPTGEVYGAPGLYVMDGAAIPSATGVNPSHTIAAVSERNAERLVATVTGRLGWRAPSSPPRRPTPARCRRRDPPEAIPAAGRRRDEGRVPGRGAPGAAPRDGHRVRPLRLVQRRGVQPGAPVRREERARGRRHLAADEALRRGVRPLAGRRPPALG